ncbi:MAG: MtrAB system histidine kinase MtrB, partial [Propionicimonas sp.]|nr:MtrAB system histidine kinase MtrB [Propionicimonas sp.]
PGSSSYPVFFLFSTLQERQTLAAVQQATWATGALLLVGLALTVYLISMLVLRPVRAARLAAERLAAGHLEDRMAVIGTEDQAALARSMNHMASELDKKITQLENLSAVQQRFVSDVSHELRTPLTTVRMAAEVIHAKKDQFDPPTARSAELLSAQLDRFEDLLTDLLEISRFDAGAAELTLDFTDLVTLVAEEIDAVAPLAVEFGTTITIDAPEAVVAEVDSRRIRRIVRNLLTNAIEHGEHRPIQVHVRSEGETVAIAVRDHGVGLTAAEARQVFDRFWRADPARGRRVGGTGLGLSISSEDARLHGGSLEAWGKPGVGAQFRLTLPRRAGRAPGPSPWPLVPPPENQEVGHAVAS